MRKRNAGKGLRVGERKIAPAEVPGAIPHVPAWQDTFHTFLWDAANQMSAASDSAGQSYTLYRDGLGRAVEMKSSSGNIEIEYSVTGSKLALMNGQSLVKGFIPLPDGARAVYNASAWNITSIPTG